MAGSSSTTTPQRQQRAARGVVKHKLDQKFKTWRKGKSQTTGSSSSGSNGSNGGQSLKNRLRGQKRLLSKLPSEESESRTALEQQIVSLETEIAEKEQAEKERNNAMTYHKVKFFERQKLTRMERTLKKSTEKKNKEVSLERIRMDRHYVTHYPNDGKYMALFSNGTRRSVGNDKMEQRRLAVRQKIARDHGYTYTIPFPTHNTYEGDPPPSNPPPQKVHPTPNNTSKQKRNNPHTTKASQHDRERQQQQVDTMDVVPPKKDSRFDTNVLLESNVLKKMEDMEQKKQSDPNNDSDDSSSDSDSDSRSDSSDGDSDTSDDHSEDVAPKTRNGHTATVDNNNNNNDDNDSEEDDFFATTTTERSTADVFKQAKALPAYDVGAKGDKSRGWATQKQYPGEYKKRRRG